MKWSNPKILTTLEPHYGFGVYPHIIHYNPLRDMGHIRPIAFSSNFQKNLSVKGLFKKNEIFVGSRISKFLRPAQRYDNFKLIRITCQAACHGKTEHGIFVKFKKPSKTAVVLIAGVTISGTPCPRHFIVPFGAEAPSGHVAQAWAIPPPSWGLLSQWHRQQTTMPETNEASSARTQRHS